MKTDSTQKIIIDEKGHVCTPKGFKASGIVAGLKRTGKPDMALLVSDTPATVAGVFTSCLFAAAPVKVCEERVLNTTSVRAIVVNSGNANACTGKKGYENAQLMCVSVANALNIMHDEVMVCSTGRIGVQLNMDIINKGIKLLTEKYTVEGGQDMVEAIMTTDTRPKQCAVHFKVPSSGKIVTIGGCCKGAGMIEPHMVTPKKTGQLHATMLAYITTDLKIEQTQLQSCLENAVNQSFNNITVDGDMSTNDSCILLANGVSGATLDTMADVNLFQAALNTLLFKLAKAIVLDAEGATKCVTIKIIHARTENDAKQAAKAVANSLLCKTAWFGGDPNWGRAMSAIGYSGAMFDPTKVDMNYDDVPVVREGQDAGTPEKVLAEVMKKNAFIITINLNDGNGSAWMLSSDISYEYVKINAEYYT